MQTIKCFLILVAIGWFFAGFISDSFAAGDADVYRVTVMSIQLLNTSDEWVTIATPNEEVNICNANAGEVARSFASDAQVPVGSYKNFRIRLSETMTVSGSDGAHYTTSGGRVTLVGDGTCASTVDWGSYPPTAQVTLSEGAESHTTTASQQGETIFTLDLNPGDGNNYIDISCKTGQSTPVVVKSDSAMNMWFDFDTRNTVHWDGGDTMYYTPPREGTAFGITVDGREITVTEGNMRIDF